MAATYSLILRACPEGSRDSVAHLLGRAFSLKDSTCVSIASSTPIVLLTELSKDEAAALGLAMVGLGQRGATVELTLEDVSELPKIDWPKRPMVFKREIAEFAADFSALTLNVPGSNRGYTLLELLLVLGRTPPRIFCSCLARFVFLPRPPTTKSMRLEKPS